MKDCLSANSTKEDATPLLSPDISRFSDGKDVPCTANHAAAPRMGEGFLTSLTLDSASSELLSSASCTTSKCTVSSTFPVFVNKSRSCLGFFSNAFKERFVATPTSETVAKDTTRNGVPRVFISVPVSEDE